MAAEKTTLDQQALDELERRYDSGLLLRPIGPLVRRAFYLIAIVFAIYHYLVAGFGVPVDYWHMGIHLTGLFFLIFIGFPFLKTERAMTIDEPSTLKPGNVPLYDWLAAIAGSLAALYLGYSWLGLEVDLFGLTYSIPEQALRQGSPVISDIIFGTILVVLVLEIARRTLGPILPCIILVFVAYALLGPHIPVQILKHPGVDWRQFINNMYFPQEGIFGVTLWVVSTMVFPFRAVRRGRPAHGPGPVLHRQRHDPGRPLHRRARQGERGLLGLLRHHLRLLDRQHRFHRLAHHPQHEAHGLSRPLRRRGRGGRQRRRADHAADHGGGLLPDGRISGGALHDHRDRGHRAGAHALCRRALHRPPGRRNASTCRVTPKISCRKLAAPSGRKAGRRSCH